MQANLKFANRLLVNAVSLLITFNFLIPSAALASKVGRLFNPIESAEAAEQSPRAQEQESNLQPAGPTPVDRDALTTLMKRPTEPHYDLLLPMSGSWARCHRDSAETSAASTQEIFSSSDRSHFSRTVSQTSDARCQNVVSAVRYFYECSGQQKTILSCLLSKAEKKLGDGPWATVPDNESNLFEAKFKLSLKLSGNKKTKTKNGVDGRKLEVRLFRSGRPDPEIIHLEFLPPIKN